VEFSFKVVPVVKGESAIAIQTASYNIDHLTTIIIDFIREFTVTLNVNQTSVKAGAVLQAQQISQPVPDNVCWALIHDLD
jgi:hypothetical protein